MRFILPLRFYVKSIDHSKVLKIDTLTFLRHWILMIEYSKLISRKISLQKNAKISTLCNVCNQFHEKIEVNFYLADEPGEVEHKCGTAI